MAALVLAAIAIPLLEVLQGGLRVTRATVHELVGTHLAAELIEQVETWPFPVLEALSKGGEASVTSASGVLVDGAPAGPGPLCYRLSPLPIGFERSLSLHLTAPDLVAVEAKISWPLSPTLRRDLVLRRMVADDRPLR